jgi:hypothetical protein
VYPVSSTGQAKAGLVKPGMTIKVKRFMTQALVNLFESMGSGWTLKIDHVTGTTTGLNIYKRL